MAVNTNNNNVADSGNLFSDSQNTDNNSTNNNQTQTNSSEVAYLKSIDTTLKDILRTVNTMSQSDAQSAFSLRTDFRDREYSRRSQRRSSFDMYSRRMDDIGGSFLDGFEEAIMENFFGDNFKEKIRETSQAFAEEFGLNLDTIRKDLGKEIGKQALAAFKRTTFGSSLENTLNSVRDRALSSLKESFERGLERYDRSRGFDITTDDSFTGRYRRAINRSVSNTQPPETNDNQPISPNNDSTPSSTGRSAINDQNWLSEFINSFDEINVSLSNIQDITYLILRELDEELTDHMELKKYSPRDMSQSDAEGLDIGDSISDAVSNSLSGLSSADDIAGTFAEIIANGEGVGALVSGLGSAAMAAAGPLIAMTAAAVLVDRALDTLGPAIEGTKKLLGSISTSMNRAADTRKKNLEAEQNRILADAELLIKRPFEILQAAAESLYNTWDNNIRTINATQGYTKDELHTLMSDYSKRLQQEGLSNVVSTATLTDNLSKVLQSGLSGAIANEFAYLATVLNSAVPTQDFFSYADSYAALAGSALQDGKSQQQAIAYANQELMQFASNVIYASRSLSGGFTTGLKDASSILSDSIKIAQSAKTTNVSEISGVLSSVSAIVGSIAPDLASSITELVTKAATGGNSSEIVALRSLAGINAGNTEFLRQFTQNPQKIFKTLFENLAQMQNMSADAFMEVAEGLSDVFGVSMDALARIDFNYLAKAVASMNVNNASLAENIQHLASGETTTSSEQLRMQQINKYMLEEGLAYVIDSEEARFIQQHLWDEQIARQMTQATYGVELRGAALQFLEGIQSTIKNILGFLNPFMLIGKSINAIGTAAEARAQRVDTESILKAVKVGNGRLQDLEALTTTNRDHQLVGDLAELITGSSRYSQVSATRDVLANSFSHGIESTTSAIQHIENFTTSASRVLGVLSSAATSALSRPQSAGGRSSVYSWGVLSKSQAGLIGKAVASAVKQGVGKATPKQQAQDEAEYRQRQLLAQKISDLTSQSVMGVMVTRKNLFTGQESTQMKYRTYAQWEKDAKNQIGIKNWDDALEAAGLTQQALKQQFENFQAQEGAIRQQERLDQEAKFWEEGIRFWTADYERKKEFHFWEVTMQYQVNELAMTTSIRDLIKNTTNVLISNTLAELRSLHTDWTNYYIKYSVYGSGDGEYNINGRKTYSYADVAKVAAQEKNESYDAVHALAEALNKNFVDLHDPTVQTNALLGKILLVLEAILQQTQTTGDNQSAQSTFNALLKGLVG